MTTEAPASLKTQQHLRLSLATGPSSIPLHRIHRLAGYASLSGTPDDYFLGWLTYHGQQIPVFDLNRVVCDQPTPETFSTRIILIATDAKAPTPYLGLLAAGATDTFIPTEAPLNIDNFLPMLYPMIPAPPEPRTVPA